MTIYHFFFQIRFHYVYEYLVQIFIEAQVWKCKQKSFLIWWTSLIMTSTWGAIKEPGHVHSGSSSVVVNASKSSTSIVLMSKLHKSCVDTCHIFHKPQYNNNGCIFNGVNNEITTWTTVVEAAMLLIYST